jgi:hypothetical protein
MTEDALASPPRPDKGFTEKPALVGATSKTRAPIHVPLLQGLSSNREWDYIVEDREKASVRRGAESRGGTVSGLPPLYSDEGKDQSGANDMSNASDDDAQMGRRIRQHTLHTNTQNAVSKFRNKALLKKRAEHAGHERRKLEEIHGALRRSKTSQSASSDSEEMSAHTSSDSPKPLSSKRKGFSENPPAKAAGRDKDGAKNDSFRSTSADEEEDAEETSTPEEKTNARHQAKVDRTPPRKSKSKAKTKLASEYATSRPRSGRGLNTAPYRRSKRLLHNDPMEDEDEEEEEEEEEEDEGGGADEEVEVEEGEIQDLRTENSGVDVSTFAVHPRANFVAVGLLNGQVEIHEFTTDSHASHELISTIPPPASLKKNKKNSLEKSSLRKSSVKKRVATHSHRQAGASRQGEKKSKRAKEGVRERGRGREREEERWSQSEDSLTDSTEAGSESDSSGEWEGEEEETSCRVLEFSPDGSRLFRASADGTIERFVFTHMDSNGRFRREWVSRGGAGITYLLPLAEGAMGGVRGGAKEGGRVTDALAVGVQDGRVRVYDFSLS